MSFNDTIRVTKTFTFDMAHALEGYDGLCRNIHGHTYHLAVTVSGRVINENGHPKNGMVIDFSDFKAIVEEHVIKVFDHALVLQRDSAYAKAIQPVDPHSTLLLTDYSPSCENLLIDCKNRISSNMPKNILLEKIQLNETPTSYAEWYRSDNY